MNNGLLLALITAAGFGVWPIIGRATGANQFWMVTPSKCIGLACAVAAAYLLSR